MNDFEKEMKIRDFLDFICFQGGIRTVESVIESLYRFRRIDEILSDFELAERIKLRFPSGKYPKDLYVFIRSGLIKIVESAANYLELDFNQFILKEKTVIPFEAPLQEIIPEEAVDEDPVLREEQTLFRQLIPYSEKLSLFRMIQRHGLYRFEEIVSALNDFNKLYHESNDLIKFCLVYGLQWLVYEHCSDRADFAIKLLLEVYDNDSIDLLLRYGTAPNGVFPRDLYPPEQDQ